MEKRAVIAPDVTPTSGTTVATPPDLVPRNLIKESKIEELEDHPIVRLAERVQHTTVNK